MTRIDRLVPWFVGAFVVTAMLAAIYLTAQHIERSGADDAGQRLASQLLDGQATDPTHVDLATSAAPFWVTYDRDGTAVDGSGYLDGALAAVPAGVITHAANDGEDKVSWEPRGGLRFAIVALRDGDRVIVAGQSLAPSEERTDSLGLLLLLGWAGCIVLLVAGALVHLRAARDFT